jgi:hypothetical protein
MKIKNDLCKHKGGTVTAVWLLSIMVILIVGFFLRGCPI